MNPKNNRVPGWLVPYLGKKVRQLRHTETALRQRIAELLTQSINQQREFNTARLELTATANYYRDYSNRLFEELIAAHKKIGALQYTLESHGIAVPELEA